MKQVNTKINTDLHSDTNGMVQQRYSRISWFVFGVFTALVSAYVFDVPALNGIARSEGLAALVLGVLLTSQFGIIMPTICVFERYSSKRFNFFYALVFLLGFVFGIGIVFVWRGNISFALAYVTLTTGVLSAIYVLTKELHHRIERNKK
jgi:hypothetical protein